MYNVYTDQCWYKEILIFERDVSNADHVMCMSIVWVISSLFCKSMKDLCLYIHQSDLGLCVRVIQKEVTSEY